jgi:flavin reductase (DIM6/NTAB) family NADH-FMN oxidoreductase RutF
MAEGTPQPRDILSEFWSPVCAVGSHDTRGPNAQICVSVLGASVVPDKPRLVVNLWKDNYTHGLVVESGTMSITVLSEEQAELVERLGMQSGRNKDKLAATDYALDSHDDPYFPEGPGTMVCEVINAFDLGDATSFVVAVRSRERTPGKIPLTRGRMHELLGPEFSRRWSEIAALRAPRYSGQMHWG